MHRHEAQRIGGHSTHLVSSAGRGRTAVRSGRVAGPLAAEQRAIGNQTMQRFAESCPARLPSPSVCPFRGACDSCAAPVQPRLKIGRPGDRYGQEADRVADAVMRMPGPLIQRQVGRGGEAAGRPKRAARSNVPQALAGRLDFYPGKPIDDAEVLLGNFAKRREREGKTAGALAIESLEDIFTVLEIVAEMIRESSGQTDVPPFMSEIHILGHGSPGSFGIGTYAYGVKYLKSLKAGRAEKYMKPGATIFLEGCDAAAGSKGKGLMCELARIFFGRKSGRVWGNTCKVLGAVVDITSCKPVTYTYPRDCKTTEQ